MTDPRARRKCDTLSEVSKKANEVLAAVTGRVEEGFRRGRRVLSFAEYLDLFTESPERYARDASRYVKDAFDHYGRSEVSYPWGSFTRFHLFDLPWEDAPPQGGRPRGTLIGQEPVQEEIYRSLENFVREGRPNRLVLLHGPNGSAKSTIVGCVLRALEDYSTKDEGALYCFSWVFPSTVTTKGGLGFAGGRSEGHASYAHLGDAELDAKLLVEVRDHPLFLIPVAERRAMLEKLGLTDASDWILRGELSHKSREVCEALLASYNGSYAEVLKHVRVERYFISQRYRVGAVTLGPQMSIDAGERQVTADRSLGSLPASLQAVNLYEAKGELVDAAGGILEFSDLLKRPLDAFKYLQLTVETGEVALTTQNIQLNCVMMGSANELHLDAFREHPEFASFRGRLELVRTPYLRSSEHERAIYDVLVAPQVRRHVAPHATLAAAQFAVLTRMRKPKSDELGGELGRLAGELSAFEKMELYAHGVAPARLENDARKVLIAGIERLYKQSDAYPIYEGRIGASPREMRAVLLDAAQSSQYQCLSPLAVLAEIDDLIARKAEFEWLQESAKEGGYHDAEAQRAAVFDHLLSLWETEMYSASGLVDESQYEELFDKYVQHVSVWSKRERIRNKLTGEYEEPDEQMMSEVEKLLEAGDKEVARKELISQIAVWAINHPNDRVEPLKVFPHLLKRMKDAIFASRLPRVAAVARDVMLLVRAEGNGLDAARRRIAEQAIERLRDKGYCEHCAADMTSMLVRRRFAHLVT